MTRDELLLELRDISPPAEPSWWLPATAQLLLFFIAVTCVAVLWYWSRRRQKRRLLLLAKFELHDICRQFDEHGDAQKLSLELSRWLKQLALLAFPEQRPAGLTGFEWLAFLDRTLGDNRFSVGEGRVFGDAVYRRRAEFDAARLIDLCASWLQAIEPRLLQRGSR